MSNGDAVDLCVSVMGTPPPVYAGRRVYYGGTYRLMDSSKPILSVYHDQLTIRIQYVTGRNIPTEIVTQQFLRLQRILCTDCYDGPEGAQSAESLGQSALSAPLHLALDDMEHGDDITEAARTKGRKLIR